MFDKRITDSDKFLDLPKVSFIVVTHNFENFVCDSLMSIKNQN